MLVRTNLSLAHYKRDCPVQEDGSVQFKWSVEKDGVFLADLSTQGKVQILCSYLVKGYLEARDQAKLGPVCRSFRRAYSIKQRETLIFQFHRKVGPNIFDLTFSFLSVRDYSRVAVTQRHAQIFFGNAKLIRSVHLVNLGLTKPLIAYKTNLTALTSIVEGDIDSLAPHLVQFVGANLESLVEIVLKSLHLKQEDLEHAFLTASQDGRASVVKMLMGRISPLFRGAYLVEGALKEAARNGHVHCLKVLSDTNNLNLEYLQIMDILSELRYSSVLLAATENNHVECVRFLRKKGFGILGSENTILEAAKLGHLECFRILFGTPSCQTPEASFTLRVFAQSFERALENNHFDFIKGLFPQYEYLFHALFDQKLDTGESYIIMNETVKMDLPGNFLSFLLIKRDIPSKNIKDALLLAVEKGNLEHVQIFFRVRAEISKSMLNKLVPIAKAGGNKALTEFLISQNEIG